MKSTNYKGTDIKRSVTDNLFRLTRQKTEIYLSVANLIEDVKTLP